MVGKDKNKNLATRPPVVVVLGHVDHGKTSLLDYIKKSHVAEKESGGITQHIGAYEIEHQGKKITFIDTPGHEAFSAMRSRGAKLADIAVLVVAGEEGVKPQTKEAIKHIKGAKLPIIVAINKIDKPQSDPAKVKRGLAEQEVLVESIGGKVPCVETSAQTGKGIPELLELILLIAEMEGLKADINKKAEGVIIESYMDQNRGPIATLILKNGVLKIGDILGTSSTFGKIKVMEDFQRKPIKRVVSSQPAIVLGLEDVPGVGEEFKIFNNIEEAKKELAKKFPKELGSFKGTEFLNGDKRVLNLILKADVLGSLEAIQGVLKALPQEGAALRILKAEVGEVNDSDVKLASGAGAVILAFRIKTNKIAQKLTIRENVRILTFEVIYELAQAVRQLLEKRRAPEIVRIELGKVRVLAIFRTDKNRQIIGGKVTEGKVQKGGLLEVFRSEEKIGQGRIIELKRDQNEVGQVEKGKDCGILYEGDIQVEEGDMLEIYVREKKKMELE